MSGKQIKGAPDKPVPVVNVPPPDVVQGGGGKAGGKAGKAGGKAGKGKKGKK